MVLSSTYSPPPTRYSRDVLEKVADLVDQLATAVHAFCSSTAVLETISQELTLQPTTTTDVATNFTCIDSQVATQIPPSPLPPSTTQPTHKGPTSLHEFTPAAASNPNATLHGLDMLTDPPKQTDALPLYRLSTKEI